MIFWAAKNTITDGGSTALYADYTVDMVYTVDVVYTVDMVYTVITFFFIKGGNIWSRKK